ncbi:MAG: hypothetical protein JNK78_15965 [Planctomycetes bacterium]|nr:hypothetical protein [Planctomycetota bacterium]
MSHPDRAAATLANVDEERAHRGAGPFVAPGPGAADCRIDVKLLQWHALAAAARSARSRERLAAFAAATRPDLWAGTTQDGTARGFMAALEEAIAIAPRTDAPPRPEASPERTTTWTGKDLRKKKDLLVASGGSRVRFSRKEGLLFVDRDGGAHSANCLRFEARTDRGTLDAFVPDDAERPRLFSAQFLQARRYVQTAGETRLLLAGRLGRGPIGWPCELEISGRDDERSVLLRLRIEHRVPGQRLRARFLGIAPGAIVHECTDVREVVENDAGGFVAFTLVRACTTLRVDGKDVPVPGAACFGTIEHRFRLVGVTPT